MAGQWATKKKDFQDPVGLEDIERSLDENLAGKVAAWSATVLLPTYPIGEPEILPMFLEHRVYQGSSGVVYPYPVVDKVGDEKVIKPYTGLFLENQYLKIMILPELGGRIHMAYDKAHKRHFVYFNRVIKPALVGLAGPWISGGIEFNWPQHHRPSTFSPVDWYIQESSARSSSEQPEARNKVNNGAVSNDSMIIKSGISRGPRTIWCSELEKMFRTKSAIGFTLYPDTGYLELSVQIYNRTPQPQTFLWWANPAVKVNQHYQSVFPPDVTAVFDHGKRDVSKFPVATGIYYKTDYSAGVDISRYKNIPVPTSFMAVESRYDFLGCYEHDTKGGLLHVANHYTVPGKKQWTWGNGNFGFAWDRNLTDEDGPYIELMCGAFTDNQPDFSWLIPGEEKSFKQYFMPFSKVGGEIKHATKDCILGIEGKLIQNEYLPSRGTRSQKFHVILHVYTTRLFKNVFIKAYQDGMEVFSYEWGSDLQPCYSLKFDFQTGPAIHSTFEEFLNKSLTVEVFQNNKYIKGLPRKVILASWDRKIDFYTQTEEHKPLHPAVPEAQKPALPPADIRSQEEVFLTGLHLEQYRHATFKAEDYYKEGIKRDPFDSRCNNALGRLHLKRAQWKQAEQCFRIAVKTLTKYNPNPYDGEPYYNLGLVLKWRQKWSEAYSCFYKACWSDAWKGPGYYQLALIDLAQSNNIDRALEHVNFSLDRQRRDHKARHLKCICLRKKLEDSIRLLGGGSDSIISPSSDAVKSGCQQQQQLEIAVACQAFLDFSKESLELDPCNGGILYENVILAEIDSVVGTHNAGTRGSIVGAEEAMNRFTGATCQNAYNYLEYALDYAWAGQWDHASKILRTGVRIDNYLEEEEKQSDPLLFFISAWMEGGGLCISGDSVCDWFEIRERVGDAGRCSPEYCLPNSLETVRALEWCLEHYPDEKWACISANYYLGCYCYAYDRHADALHYWESSLLLLEDETGDGHYAVSNGEKLTINQRLLYILVRRNLSLVIYNKFNGKEAKTKDAPLKLIESAFWCAKKVLNERERTSQRFIGLAARLLFEFDQLRKKLNVCLQERFNLLKEHEELVDHRDDLTLEYVTLSTSLVATSLEADPMSILLNRKFHPWEGGEGKPTKQYVLCCIKKALQQLVSANQVQPNVALSEVSSEQVQEARKFLEQARGEFPYNLGEGKLPNRLENDLDCLLGYCGVPGKFEEATRNLDIEPLAAVFYNDQEPDKIFFQGVALLALAVSEFKLSGLADSAAELNSLSNSSMQSTKSSNSKKSAVPNSIAPILAQKSGFEVRLDQARSRFNKLMNFGESHLDDEVTMEYFAVSMPDLAIWHEPLSKKNKVHCLYMLCLAHLGFALETLTKLALQVGNPHRLGGSHKDSTTVSPTTADITQGLLQSTGRPPSTLRSSGSCVHRASIDRESIVQFPLVTDSNYVKMQMYKAKTLELENSHQGILFLDSLLLLHKKFLLGLLCYSE